jgi:hypothetical protein
LIIFWQQLFAGVQKLVKTFFRFNKSPESFLRIFSVFMILFFFFSPTYKNASQLMHHFKQKKKPQPFFISRNCFA